MSESDDLGSLYPFLYAGKTDVEAVLVQVERSTREKSREIVELRDRLAAEDGARLRECGAAIGERLGKGGRLFAFGNGGSSTDAQAVAQLFLQPPRGRPVPAFSLTNDIAVMTALSNDIGFDVVFARQLAAFGTPLDVALGISTSGSSANVLLGLAEASRLGLLTVGLAGGGGGKMSEADTIDYLFVVPSSSVHRIQEAQTTVYQVLWELAQGALEESEGVAHIG